LVVISGAADLRDEGPEWTPTPIIAAESKPAINAAPSGSAQRLRRFMRSLQLSATSRRWRIPHHKFHFNNVFGFAG
jgi:hypothetical protein